MRLAKRQMLHAWRIKLIHPVTKKIMEFEAPVPDDMADLISELKRVNVERKDSRIQGVKG